MGQQTQQIGKSACGKESQQALQKRQANQSTHKNDGAGRHRRKHISKGTAVEGMKQVQMRLKHSNLNFQKLCQWIPVL